MECILPYLCMVTVPHIMVGLENVGLARFHCNNVHLHIWRCACEHLLSLQSKVTIKY